MKYRRNMYEPFNKEYKIERTRKIVDCIIGCIAAATIFSALTYNKGCSVKMDDIMHAYDQAYERVNKDDTQREEAFKELILNRD